jgi:DNA repair photolyase
MPPDDLAATFRWKLARGGTAAATSGAEGPSDDADSRLFDLDSIVTRHVGTGEYQGMEFLHVNARSIINRVPAASRMPFRHTINVYRGCAHGCVYCFARPTHAYLGLGIGEDFDRRIVVKVNAVECLRSELRSPRWAGERIAMGTNTDPYQKAEGRYHLTRGVVEVLAEASNPFSILTKSTLVLRDLRLLAETAKTTETRLAMSIGTLDRDVWRQTEPGTPPPEKRVEAVRKLNEAGVPCSVLVAPLLPGLSDSDEQIAAVLEACLDAGAVSVSAVPLHLRGEVREHYLGWLEKARPDLMAEHERRFARGAYQPAIEQRRISRLVDEFRARAGLGAPESDGVARTPDGDGETSAPAVAPGPVPVQLSFIDAPSPGPAPPPASRRRSGGAR